MPPRDDYDNDFIEENIFEDLCEQLGRNPTDEEVAQKKSGLSVDLWEQFNMGKGVEND
tara:strand:+ start:750 stop:923 length:174 start_codon:yes stop_codon:yes gene_type:complete